MPERFPQTIQSLSHGCPLFTHSLRLIHHLSSACPGLIHRIVHHRVPARFRAREPASRLLPLVNVLTRRPASAKARLPREFSRL